MTNSNVKLRKKQILIIALVLAFFQTIFIEIFHSILKVHYAYLLIYSILMFAWVHYDNYEYKYKRSLFFNLGLIAFFILFFPIYIYKTRNNLKSTVKITGILLLVIALMEILHIVGLLFYGIYQNPKFFLEFLSCLWDSSCKFSINL